MKTEKEKMLSCEPFYNNDSELMEDKKMHAFGLKNTIKPPKMILI